LYADHGDKVDGTVADQERGMGEEGRDVVLQKVEDLLSVQQADLDHFGQGVQSAVNDEFFAVAETLLEQGIGY
jgi:hypothetical protein